jgi:tetratricopeptide (TPR) repeat protein
MDSYQTILKQAFAAYNGGHYAEAETLCRSLMQSHSADAQLLFLLGMTLHKTRRDAEAISRLRQAAELQSEARIFNGLGCAYHSSGNYPRAIESFAKAIQLQPQNADLFYSLGNSHHKLDEIEPAVAAFRRAVELNPRDSASWNNLGKCLLELNFTGESIVAYDRAVALEPDYVLAHYGRAIALLTAGRLPEGFREYEWRHRKLPPRQFPQPLWNGEPIAGKTLFLYAEQGFGDAIQAVRFVRMARTRVAKVIVECRPELKTLFIYSDCADVVIAFGEALPPFDYFNSLTSLPGILGITRETIPNETPYLKAPPGENLPPAPAGHLKAGLAWAGNPGHHNDAARSLNLEQLAPVLQTPNVTFYSLQVPMPERDQLSARSFPQLVNPAEPFNDFLDTAATVAQMDLIICVDTAVAHLAGALAKPVWNLIPHSPDWRWFLERPDTVWYPTMRLFRQPQRNQWPPVIAQVAEELRQLTSQKTSPT